MKKYIFIIALFLACVPVSAQTTDDIAVLAIKKDSLTAVLRGLESKIKMEATSRQKALQSLRDSVSMLKSNEKFAEDKAEFDSLVRSKDMRIKELEGRIVQIHNEMDAEDLSFRQQAEAELIAGQNSSLAVIASVYTDNPFEELLKSTSTGSVKRDLELLAAYPDACSVLKRLLVYHEAEDLLKIRFDEQKVTESGNSLLQLPDFGGELESLWNKLDSYGAFVSTLGDYLTNISRGVYLDSNGETVHPQTKDEEKSAFWIKWVNLTDYIHYGFNFNDYPYLSDIILELIKKDISEVDCQALAGRL